MLFDGKIYFDEDTKAWGASVPALDIDMWGETKQTTFQALAEALTDLAEFPDLEVDIRNYDEPSKSFDLHLGDCKESLAFVIARMRAKEGLTLRQIAKLTGQNFTAYGAYERGEKVPSLLKFSALAATANMELKLVPGKVSVDQSKA